MKKILSILLLFISVFSFGQNTHIPTAALTIDSLNANYLQSSSNIPLQSFRIKRVSLNGVSSVIASGDSYTNAQGAPVTAQGYIQLFANKYNLTLTNKAVSGSGAYSAASQMNRYIDPANNTSIITNMSGFNDYRRSGANTLTNKELASCISSIIANNLIDSFYAANNAHLIKGGAGGWTTFTPSSSGGKADYYGGLGEFSNSANDSITFFSVGDAFIIGYINQTTSGFAGGNFNVYADDSLCFNVVCDAANGISDGVNSNLVAPGAAIVKGLGSGLHKVVIKHTTANYTYIDYVATVKNPLKIAPILLSLIPKMTAIGYAISPSSGNNICFNQGDSTILATAYKFIDYNVGVVFPMDYFNLANGLSSDNIHPNQLGYQQILSSFCDHVYKNNTGMLGVFSYGNNINPISAPFTAGLYSGSIPGFAMYNSSAGADSKIYRTYEDATGNYKIDALRDDGTSPIVVLQQARSGTTLGELDIGASALKLSGNKMGIGITPTAVGLEISGATPLITIDQTSGTSIFYGLFASGGIDYNQVSINRNPNTGTIAQTGKAAATWNLTSAAGESEMNWYTSTTNNTSPTLRETLLGNGHHLFNTTTDSSAWIHIGAGTTSLAPLKFTSGPLLTTPKNGVFEFFDHLYFTVSGTRYQIDQQTTSAFPAADYTLTADRTLNGSTGTYGLNLGASGNRLNFASIYSAGSIGLHGLLTLDPFPTITDANYVAPANISTYKLPVITANRTFTPPTGGGNALLFIYDANTAGFTWNPAGTNFKDATGTTITSFTNNTFYIFMNDGTNWIQVK